MVRILTKVNIMFTIVIVLNIKIEPYKDGLQEVFNSSREVLDDLKED